MKDPRPEKSMKGYLAVALIVLVVLGIPAIKRTGGKTPFNDAPIQELREMDPDYVFIGNSFLDTRIDPGYLGELLGGEKAVVLFGGGEMSAHWYLRFKNHVVASGIKPKLVLFFFDDASLTMPTARISGRYRKQLEVLALKSEPEMERIFEKNLQPNEKMAAFFERVYPVQAEKRTVERYIKGIALLPVFPQDFMYLVRKFKGMLGGKRVTIEEVRKEAELLHTFSQKANDVFAYEKLRTTSATGFTRGASSKDLDFEKRCENSFLPVIIRLARENDIGLAFVRIKTRPANDGVVRQSDAMKKYVEDLEAYVESEGALFHDFTDDPDIRVDSYLDGAHIAPDKKIWYTELFLSRFREAFE